ncbi:glutathione S-transferase C-terminal domain-containing protein homolog [Polistes fuscatus]|uniref:glutathione S-transferase C-terminal domain-containing protein homolog n=1 Tax=Polistes fuscatus TaxID=30207 RepID=UPI001CA96915|nr:glutathione S-transferase C-terminal domain-containing protein homolog [Polistes fuscatus]
MDETYLEIYSLTDLCLAPIETIITLLTMKYCNSKINIKLIKTKQKLNECAYVIDISQFVYEIMDEDKIPHDVNSCELPSIVLNKTSYIAGLCAILRQIIKTTLVDCPLHYCKSLLGFKESCLLACSESSIWTKFCEIDIINMLKFLNLDNLNEVELPYSLARFECHMSQPLKIHNLYKYVTSKKNGIKDVVVRDNVQLPEHKYAEGFNITLSDIIIFICVHILLTMYSRDAILKLLPLITKWYERMIQDHIILECLSCLSIQEKNLNNDINYILPKVPYESLYKSDPKRYQPKSRVYTKQKDIEYSMQIIHNAEILSELDAEPFGAEICFDWTNIPFDLTPEGGSLPLSRLQRKSDQLENLCKPVIKLAKTGDVIVDFCSGSGHLGVLLAYLLPNCTIILLENKEESLNRAKKRSNLLKLTNIKFYQCNLDYFKGDFNIGLSLHACGVATDLVIQQCIKKNAIFVSCPCCYGSLHNCHHLTYPRSDIFKKHINTKQYLTLSHAADQTHDKLNVKTQQGYDCMAIIDTDRKLQAEQFNYIVYLGKLIPETCTPKNHLLVGIPKEKHLSIKN